MWFFYCRSVHNSTTLSDENLCSADYWDARRAWWTSQARLHLPWHVREIPNHVLLGLTLENLRPLNKSWVSLWWVFSFCVSQKYESQLWWWIKRRYTNMTWGSCESLLCDLADVHGSCMRVWVPAVQVFWLGLPHFRLNDRFSPRPVSYMGLTLFEVPPKVTDRALVKTSCGDSGRETQLVLVVGLVLGRGRF